MAHRCERTMISGMKATTESEYIESRKHSAQSVNMTLFDHGETLFTVPRSMLSPPDRALLAIPELVRASDSELDTPPYDILFVCSDLCQPPLSAPVRPRTTFSTPRIMPNTAAEEVPPQEKVGFA